MLRYRVILAGLSVALFINAGCAAAAPLSCVDLLHHMQERHIPNVAVMVFDHGSKRALYCATEGLSLAPDATFEAASLSKPVFAIGVLHLVESHKLDLDRPLSQYLRGPYRHQQDSFGDGPTDTVSDPRFAEITARMVLSHTTGLPNWAHMRPLALQADPGKQWGYSGEAYVYLQHVVEAITNQPLDVYLRRTVLVPLGMIHSGFVWQSIFAATAVSGFSRDGVSSSIAHYTKPLASSTLYTTLDDYGKFVAALLRPPPRSPFTMEEKEQVVADAALDLAWGLGVGIEQRPTQGYFHWGSSPGFQSFFLCQPTTGKGVLFFTDSDQGLDLLDAIVKATIPGSHPILKFPMLHPND